jgi:hypothetical protein
MNVELNRHELQIMSSKGHSSIKWSPNNPAEVEAAEDTFDNYIEKRFSAFRVAKGGGQGERITRFDPDAAEIIMVPPISGG